MIYDLNNPFEVEQFKTKCTALIESGCVVQLARKMPKRTNQQNAYLHVILGYFGAEYGWSIDEVKIEIYKRLCNANLFVVEKINKRGRRITALRSSSELTTAEMTLSIERFRNYAASVCGIYLPAPDEKEFLLHCEKVIEQNNEYL